MLFIKKANLFKNVSENHAGITTVKREDIKEVYCSTIQSLNKSEANKVYGIDEDILGQVFIPALNTEDLLSSTHIEIDEVNYFIREIYNYPPTHAILLLKRVK